MSELTTFVPIRLILVGCRTSIVDIPLQIDQIGLEVFEVTSGGAASLAGNVEVQTKK